MNKRTALKQLIFSLFLLAVLAACGSPSSVTSGASPESGRAVILSLQIPSENTGNLKTLNAPSGPITLIGVEVRGDGKVLASETAPVSPEESLIKVTLNILPGNRTFSVTASNAAGELVSEGSTTVDIKASGGDVPQVVVIALKAVQGPTLTPPSPITLPAADALGLEAINPEIQAFLSGATAFDAAGNAIGITNDAPATFPIDVTTVTFSATDSDGNTVSATSTVTINASLPPTFALTVTPTGTGTGTVTSAPLGINCGLDCTELYDSGTVVTLTATAAVGSIFVSFSGDLDCADGSVTMTVARGCTVTFNLLPLPTHTLLVTQGGTGTGTVTSVPAGINCGVSCTKAYASGTVVTLTATAAVGSSFVSFSGDADCVDGSVTMTTSKGCRATFNLLPLAPQLLTVTPSGLGVGNVTSSPAGINCGGGGGVCTASYASGTVVTLTATPAAGSVFAGFGGNADCTDGSVTMTGARNCTATFNSVAFALTVTSAGDGFGIVTSVPAGINCGANCTEVYGRGTVVTLTATPAFGSIFAGFTGDADCIDGSVTMTSLRNCTATFNLGPFPLTVTSAGAGFGLVTSVPAGIICGLLCTEVYDSGTVVTLTAEPVAGVSVFAGFGGDADCADGSVTMTAARNCTATFNPETFALTVTPAGDGEGTVTSTPAGISCGLDCTELYDFPTVVTLTATPTAGSVFSGFGGDLGCAGGSVTMTVARGCTATFSVAALLPVTFAPATNFAVGVQPLSVVTGDFNEDGKLDLVAANFTTNNVSVLLGNGTGSFGIATTFAVGAAPLSVVTGDFNGDGKLDLATANKDSNNVSILLGDGAGSFGVTANFSVGAGARSVAVGDFNGDGKLDLATANENSNNVSILLGNGDGSFGTASNFSVGTQPQSVAIGDLNGDGKSDLAVVNRNVSNVSILLGNGTGSFGIATDFSTGVGPISVAIGDLNRDGKPDLATANVTGTVSILLGNGAGSFGLATNFTAGPSTLKVVIGDFNGDGDSDLATANQVGKNVSILLGNGTGFFGLATNFSVGVEVFSLAIGDFNGDGKLDITTANQGGNNVSVLLNTTLFPSSGSFGAASTFSEGLSPRSVATGDLNGDGNLDLATANMNSHVVSIRLGDGAGGFGPSAAFGVGTHPFSVALGDLNGDGNLDLAVANFTSSDVSIRLGDGAGGFGILTNFPVGTTAVAVAIGDLNGDGKPDLAVANSDSDNVSILLGNGTGRFGLAINFSVGIDPDSIAIGDLNGDGKPDLAVGNRFSDDVSILLGDGTGSFDFAVNFATTGSAPRSVAIGDLNGDGSLDLAVANSSFGGSDVSILLGDGGGFFAPATSFSVGLRPQEIKMGDFNRDGNLDLVTANFASSDISILLGDGTGSFGPAKNIGNGLAPSSVAIGDFNEDGRLDLAVTDFDGDNVFIRLN